jgi:hypothetical protein
MANHRATKDELKERIEEVAKLAQTSYSRSHLILRVHKKYGFTIRQARNYVQQAIAKDYQFPEQTKQRGKRRTANKKVKLRVNERKWPKASFFLCTDCDKHAKEYHHPDYRYPLWVEPVCRPCHLRVHAIIRQQLDVFRQHLTR